MPLFVAEHTWDIDRTTELMKGAQPIFTGEGFPSNVKLHASYLYKQMPKMICIWEADKVNSVKEIFDAMKDDLPTMKNKFYPSVQVYPTVEIKL